jgi:hypothetical protein
MGDFLTGAALDWARTHIDRFGDTDLFPVPFEYVAIATSWQQVRDTLAATDLGEYLVGAFRRVLVPKPTGGFRAATQLDPLDALVYAAMLYDAAGALEDARVPAERRIACSYRLDLQPNGQLFSRADGWKDFTDASRSFVESGEFRYVVTADITDFYGQISLHRIRNAVDAAMGAERAKNLEEFLLNLTRGHLTLPPQTDPA